MQSISNGYRGLSLLVGLNWDRLISVGVMAVGLLTGAYVASFFS